MPFQERRELMEEDILKDVATLGTLFLQRIITGFNKFKILSSIVDKRMVFQEQRRRGIRKRCNIGDIIFIENIDSF